MDIKQITDTLDRIFQEQKKRIVFWYDGEKEFDDILPSIQIDDVSLLRLDEHSPLELKIKLESEDTEGKYILYSPYHEPPPEKDWLFDIRLYSYTFHADKASILLKELNLAGTTIIMVTHSPHDASYANRIINLFDGKVVTEKINEEFHI